MASIQEMRKFSNLDEVVSCAENAVLTCLDNGVREEVVHALTDLRQGIAHLLTTSGSTTDPHVARVLTQCLLMIQVLPNVHQKMEYTPAVKEALEDLFKQGSGLTMCLLSHDGEESGEFDG